MTRKHRHRDDYTRQRGTFDEEFFFRHIGYVREKLRRLGLRGADLDDLEQQTFVVAHRRWAERPRSSGRNRNWLEAIAWRLGMNWRRRKIRRREVFESENFDEFAANTAEPESLLELQRIFDPTNEALLPEDRAMLIAYYVNDESLTECAAHFGLPRSTAWTRLQRIRRDVLEGTRASHERPWSSF